MLDILGQRNAPHHLKLIKIHTYQFRVRLKSLTGVIPAIDVRRGFKCL